MHLQDPLHLCGTAESFSQSGETTTTATTVVRRSTHHPAPTPEPFVEAGRTKWATTRGENCSIELWDKRRRCLFVDSTSCYTRPTLQRTRTLIVSTALVARYRKCHAFGFACKRWCSFAALDYSTTTECRI